MPHLFSPLTLRSLTLRNRIVVSPMQQYNATDGIPSTWHLVHLGSRAVGGAGLIITECTAVNRDGMNTPYDTGLWNDAQQQAWRPIVDFVHAQGAKIAVQLWHAGGKGSHGHPREGMKPLTPAGGGWVTKSASATPMGGLVPEAMTCADIQAVQADFVSAAQRAVAAGFDAIELHGAHGYLLHQFLSRLVNHREDEYGGSLENRARLLLDTLDDVRGAIPESMPLLVRLSAVDFSDAPEAWTLDDTVTLSRMLRDRGADLITASGGGLTQVDKSVVHPGYQVPFATRIREEVGIPVGAVGLITTPEQAEAIIQEARADLTVIAREHLRDPYFALHAARELGAEVEVPWQYARAF